MKLTIVPNSSYYTDQLYDYLLEFEIEVDCILDLETGIVVDCTSSADLREVLSHFVPWSLGSGKAKELPQYAIFIFEGRSLQEIKKV